jgi:hypothetical protein
MVTYDTRVYTSMCINEKINSKKELVDYNKKLPEIGVLRALKWWGLDKHQFIYNWRHI